MADQALTDMTLETNPDGDDIILLSTDVSTLAVSKSAQLTAIAEVPANARVFNNQAATPANPATGDTKLYVGDDGKAYLLDSVGNISGVGGGLPVHAMQARLCLTSGDPDIREKASATTLYYTPYKGRYVRTYDSSSSTWVLQEVTELSLKLTDVQTGDMTIGSPTISDLTDTSKFVAGMEVSGIGIPTDTTVIAFPTTTSVTLSKNVTATGNDISLTFKFPATSKFDMFLRYGAAAPVFRRPIKWSNHANRNYALGEFEDIVTLDTEDTSQYIGTFETGVAGECFDLHNHYGSEHTMKKSLGFYRWMPQKMKDNATWTVTSDTGTLGVVARCYDGDLATYGYVLNMPDYMNFEVDFGFAVTLDQINIYQAYSNNDFENVWVYGSDTGAFAGEETALITNETILQTFKDVPIDFTAASYRYWKIRVYGSVADYGAIHDINFHYLPYPPLFTGTFVTTDQKAAATWSVKKYGGGAVTDAANVYDGDTGTYAYITNQTDGMYIEVDWGEDIVVDHIRVVNGAVISDRMDALVIEGSDTGDWTGEQEVIHTLSTGLASYDTYAISFAAAQYRYWRLSIDGVGSSNYGRVYEVNFRYGATLVLQGIPWGCGVSVWNGSTLVGSQISDSAVRPGLVEFEDIITSVDTMTVTRPDGSTPWLTFGIDPDTGSMYTMTQSV